MWCISAMLRRPLTAARVTAVLLAAGSIACSGIRLGDATSADGGAQASAPAGADAAVQGIDCIDEPSTGAALCTAVSSCPDVVVDHDAYPSCGFRVRFGGLDLECACNGQLCPVGAPASCDEARKLLAAQTQGGVCTQVSEGRCTAAAAAGGAGPSSSCDRACAGECGGDPGCIKLCGC